MENYNHSSNMAIDITFQFIKERMAELGISQHQLSIKIDVSHSTLARNFSKETEMSLPSYYKICGALNLRPFLVPSEDDDTVMNRVSFN